MSDWDSTLAALERRLASPPRLADRGFSEGTLQVVRARRRIRIAIFTALTFAWALLAFSVLSSEVLSAMVAQATSFTSGMLTVASRDLVSAATLDLVVQFESSTSLTMVAVAVFTVLGIVSAQTSD